MANSIKKYVFSASHTSNTAFPAPNFMTGRQSDIKVKVGKEELQSNQYSLGTNQGGSWEVKFNAGFLPNEGDSIRIYRQTGHDGRLVDFVDGSLLTSETLDLDSDQLFNIAIEAYDKGDEATIGSESFYYSQGTNPNDDITGNVDTGTLWYDTSNTPFQLKVWNGSEWQATAPARVIKRYGTSTSNGKIAVDSYPANSAFSQFTDAAFNSDSSLYLNGVKLVQTTNILNIPAGGDYTVDNGTVVFLDLSSASDILVSETFSGHFSSSVFDAETNAAASAATAGQSAAGAETSSQISSNHRLDAEDARDDAAKYASHPKNSTFSTHDNSATGQYSAKHYAETAADSATTASNAATSATVTTVATDLALGSNSKIKKVSDDIDDVTAVAGKLTEIDSLAGKTSEMTTLTTGTALSDINTVAGKATEVGQVAAIDSEIADVALKLSEIDAVEAKLSDIEDVAEVATQVSDVATAIPDITTVATEPYKSKIETVYTHRDTITDVGGEITKVTTVANDLTGANNIGTLADPTYKQQVTDVANQIGAVGTVSASINNNDISTVVSNIENIGTVADISDDVTNLSKSTGDMSTLVSKLSQTTDLAGAVNDAQASATAAAGSASTASTHANTASGHASTAATHAANLGSVAYQDLTAIAESKSLTATDVFVYDTSKDSDGGAWRNRTQGTSWYNEALNTSTRGATKKFPAVAVIVASNGSGTGGDYGGVDIYDATDPACPLWMKFNGSYSWSNGGMLVVAGRTNNAEIKSVKMLDGKLFVGSNDSPNGASALFEIDFIKDKAKITMHSLSKILPHPNIAARHQDLGINGFTADFETRLVSSKVNDVAVKVLPNAPIDPDTGLPVPTIAVATDGGVSVIKDDLSAVDITLFSVDAEAANVGFTYDNELFVHAWYSPTVDSKIYIYDIPDSDIAHGYYKEQYSGTSFLNGHGNASQSRSVVQALPYGKEGIVGAVRKSIPHLLLAERHSDLKANITSSYNTGWMNGDIKLATLMDTTAETITDSSVTNADENFNSNTGWGTSGGWSIDTGNGVATCDGSSSNGYVYETTAATRVGTQYKVTFTVSAYTQGVIGVSFATGGLAQAGVSGTGTYTYYGTVTGNDRIYLRSEQNFIGSVSNFTISELVQDRSVNNNGLNIVGNVPKTAVATGAELVSYGSFHVSSRRLIQPYNSDLDFGTGDFTIMSWAKPTQLGDLRVIASRYADNGADPEWSLRKLADNTFSFTGNSGVSVISGGTAVLNKWHHVVATRKDGVVYLYVDGALVGSVSYPNDLTNTSAPLYIGAINNNVSQYFGWYGNLSLFRISATAPTPEQIAKIYRDEKPLFQEGAKCTLSGKDDVQAIAYDEDTGKLHVGNGDATSGRYRDEFVGLQNVNPVFRDTYSIGTAISAVNGLVVEE
jgi:hypothetical protein